MAFSAGGGGASAPPSGSTAAVTAFREALRSGPQSAGPQVSPYQIPIRTGGYSYLRPANEGLYDDDPSTRAPGDVKQRETKDIIERFSLTDEGVNGAKGIWYAFDDETRETLMKRMWYLGLIKTPSDFDSAYGVWATAVTHAARFANSGKEIDPHDVLEMLADAEGGPKGPKKQGPTTRRQIDLTDPETVKAWVQEAFKQSMGRRADDAEVRAMTDALHAAQKMTPAVSTTTPTKWDENGNPIESNTTTSGGVDPDAFFRNQMDADPEAGAHQAAASLFPALMQALGGGLG